jgi:hypothetical protein
MKTQQILLPYVLIGFGVIYLIKPDIFHSFLSGRKPADERRPMTAENRRFMKTLGTIFLVSGLVILIYWGRFH